MNLQAVISKQDFVKIMNLRNGECICAARSGYPVVELGTRRGTARACHNLRERLLCLGRMAQINPSLFCPAQAKWCAEDEEKSNCPLRFSFFVRTLRPGGPEAVSLQRHGFLRTWCVQSCGTLQHPALSGMDLNFRLPCAEPFLDEHPLFTLQGGWRLDKCIVFLSSRWRLLLRSQQRLGPAENSAHV